ncbi:hypothetical protein ACFGVS_02340 [Mucilaginibacter sp. AW1-7]|uniref:hypothetical protein n=1 Tax=unclassified Mucilaginibacter TaxID=2617802 RepID=UPI002366BC02|nr:hypothetical protein [Mucilaginibacter sp. KACC 22773]WDF75302.1 hypothetical protein PQ469_15535 [Mucilaginibacter sp. KACC 22773]
MEQFRSFDQLRTNQLIIIRNGFFRPSFELSDGQFSYGKLSYGNIWKTTMILESAQKTWIIKRKAIFSRTLLIKDVNEIELGAITPEILSRKVKLSMNNGFEAVYAYKKIFTRTFSLTNDQYGDILSVKTAVWGFKKPFEVSIDLDKLKSIPDMPLLVLLGVNLILIKQAQAAAAAGS